MSNYFYYIASTYGSSAYNTSTYNGATSGSSAGASGGALTDTGFLLVAVLTAACVIALTAMVIKIWKRPAKKSFRSTQGKPVAETIEVEE